MMRIESWKDYRKIRFLIGELERSPNIKLFNELFDYFYPQITKQSSEELFGVNVLYLANALVDGYIREDAFCLKDFEPDKFIGKEGKIKLSSIYSLKISKVLLDLLGAEEVN